MPITQADPIPQFVSPPMILRDGDRLEADEYLRLYELLDDTIKAELIEGVVYMAAALPLDHGSADVHLGGWLDVYSANTPHTRAVGNATIRLGPSSVPQPDACLFCIPPRPSLGRAARYLEGSPELALEVAVSSARLDLGPKLRAYEQAGAREYIVWQPELGQLDWFWNNAGTFERLTAGPNGIVRSLAFPGLWLDLPALLRGDRLAVYRTLNLGLASPEHAAFCVLASPPADAQ